MLSLQRLLSRDDKFFHLMEGSAEEASVAIQGLVALLRAPAEQPTLDSFVEARRKEKSISNELTEQLCRTFVTPLEREDIEALSHALYKIPKVAEKFAERYLISGPAAQKLDFSRHLELLDRAGQVLVLMVKQLRSGVALQTVKGQNRELQQIEGAGDKLMLETLQQLYESTRDPFDVMLMKDLLEMLEKVLDRCRDVGNIVFHIILKHS
jgi:uncharacterized protein Yka (UPF0111/DUF47 family)